MFLTSQREWEEALNGKEAVRCVPVVPSPGHITVIVPRFPGDVCVHAELG